MKKSWMSMVLFLGVLTSVSGQTNQQAFFRVTSSSNAVITGLDPLEGTITWANDSPGMPSQLQRAFILDGTSNWVDFVQLISTVSVVGTETILDLDPPESMVFIPGGVFQMGDTFEEGGADELPVHSVYVSGFYMAKYEVTKALWDEVYAWAEEHDYNFLHDGSGKATNHPVHTVNWYDCVKWCNARSEMEGRTPCYNLDDWSCNFDANGYRLPTEAEWEKAARGGLNGQRFGWGDLITHDNANYFSDDIYDYDKSSSDGYHPSYDEDGVPYSSPVGSFAPNGYGLYDMVGNMFEWTGDRHVHTYYESSPSSNPYGPSTGSDRVARGGSWKGKAVGCRSAFRDDVDPDEATNDRGFRIVLPSD